MVWQGGEALLFSHLEHSMRNDQHIHLNHDRITATVATDPLTLTVTITEKDQPLDSAAFVFYAESLDQILDLGYEIVNAVRRQQGPNQADDCDDFKPIGHNPDPHLKGLP